MYFHHFEIIFPWKRARSFIWTNFNARHPRVLCAKLGWNWPSGSREQDFLNTSMYYRYFVIISPLNRMWPFIWTNLNPIYPRMICAKFGWNWPSGSGEEDFFKYFNVFLLFRNYFPLGKGRALYLNKLDYPLL